MSADPITLSGAPQPLVIKAHTRGRPTLVSLHNLAEGSSHPSILLPAREIVRQLAEG